MGLVPDLTFFPLEKRREDLHDGLQGEGSCSKRGNDRSDRLHARNSNLWLLVVCPFHESRDEGVKRGFDFHMEEKSLDCFLSVKGSRDPKYALNQLWEYRGGVLFELGFGGLLKEGMVGANCFFLGGGILVGNKLG